MDNDWSYRDYTPEDYELALLWCAGHGKGGPREEWLPQEGFVLLNPDPAMMFWLYFDRTCDAAFGDWLITRPGLPIPAIKAGLIYALHGPIKEAMYANFAHTLITRSPAAIARYFSKVDGWHINDKELFSLCYQFREEDFHEDL